MKYYGLISGLPVPKPGQALVFNLMDLRQQIEPYLEGRDLAAIRHFFYRIDLANLESLIYGQNRWLRGGNMTEESLRKSLNPGSTLEWPLSDEAPSQSAKSPIQQLHLYWQRYYAIQFEGAPDEIDRMLAFEISIKNFMAGQLQQKLAPDQEPQFLDGGLFDRFAYARMLMADIQAEFPYLSAVLASLPITDPNERQEKITEAKWLYYEYVAFFDPFGLPGLFSLLLRYLDQHSWQQRDETVGQVLLDKFRQSLRLQTESLFA